MVVVGVKGRSEKSQRSNGERKRDEAIDKDISGVRRRQKELIESGHD